jgi:Papain fold toxin 1, glutamine deamidase
VATQNRLTGKGNAVADPSNGYGTYEDLNPAFPYGRRQGTTTPAEIEKELLEMGDGATGFVIVPQRNDILHALNVVNRNGKVYFIDSQIEKIVTLDPTLKVEFGVP